MVRIGHRARTTLRELVARTGRSTREILDEAVEAYRRQRFLEDANAAFAALRKDERARKAERVERKLWEKTLADGLDED
jgi:hypothetical protein